MDAYEYLPGAIGDVWERMCGETGDGWQRLAGTIGDAWERLIVACSPVASWWRVDQEYYLRDYQRRMKEEEELFLL